MPPKKTLENIEKSDNVKGKKTKDIPVKVEEIPEKVEKKTKGKKKEDIPVIVEEKKEEIPEKVEKKTKGKKKEDIPVIVEEKKTKGKTKKEKEEVPVKVEEKKIKPKEIVPVKNADDEKIYLVWKAEWAVLYQENTILTEKQKEIITLVVCQGFRNGVGFWIRTRLPTLKKCFLLII